MTDGLQEKGARARTFVAGWLATVVLGVAFGVMEGWIYQHPRVNPYAYWAVLVSLEFITLAGYVGAARAARLLPTLIVVQDAASLLAQGAMITEANWYATYFGHHFLTESGWIAGTPNFYPVGIAISLVTETVALAAAIVRGREESGADMDRASA